MGSYYNAPFYRKWIVFGIYLVLLPGSALVCINAPTQHCLPWLWSMQWIYILGCEQIFVDSTFYWLWSGVESGPLSDSVPAVLIPSPTLLPLAAG